MLPKKGVLSAVVWTVHRWYLDCAAGLEESSTSEVHRLQKFCRRNCWVFAAPCKSERHVIAESAKCCRTRRSNRLPSREAPARTATGEPDMPLWTWHILGWVANGVRIVPAWCDHDATCQWSIVQWRSAQTANLHSRVFGKNYKMTRMIQLLCNDKTTCQLASKFKNGTIMLLISVSILHWTWLVLRWATVCSIRPP